MTVTYDQLKSERNKHKALMQQAERQGNKVVYHQCKAKYDTCVQQIKGMFKTRV